MFGGCAVNLQEDKLDAERTSALEMPLDRVVVDNLDFEAGDTRDWKYFTLPTDGLVQLTVGFDVESTQPTVRVLDEVGQVLQDLDLPESSASVRRLSFEAKPGNYYLHVAIAQGESDYSAEVIFTPGLGAKDSSLESQ